MEYREPARDTWKNHGRHPIEISGPGPYVRACVRAVRRGAARCVRACWYLNTDDVMHCASPIRSLLRIEPGIHYVPGCAVFNSPDEMDFGLISTRAEIAEPGVYI